MEGLLEIRAQMKKLGEEKDRLTQELKRITADKSGVLDITVRDKRNIDEPEEGLDYTIRVLPASSVEQGTLVLKVRGIAYGGT